MSKPNPRHIPTLGYPSQKAAVIALFLDGVEPNDIAEAVGAPINAVQRSLSEYRRDNSLPTPPRKKPSSNMKPWGQPDDIWNMNEDDRREEFARRAARGAREARMAA